MESMKWLLGIMGSLLVSSVFANAKFDIAEFNISKLELNQQKVFKAFSEDLGSALSYKAVTPAESLGGGITLIGFDVGLGLMVTSLEQTSIWGDVIAGDSGFSRLPLPKLHAHLGLPFGIDVGAVYADTSPFGSNVKYIGGALRYSFVSGNVAMPAIAVRGALTSLNGIDELNFSTKSVELTISKGFLMLTPYGGIGNVWVTSDPDVTLPNGSTVLEKESFSLAKWFVGLNVNLGLMNLAFETDKTGDAQSYSFKLGFRF